MTSFKPRKFVEPSQLVGTRRSFQREEMRDAYVDFIREYKSRVEDEKDEKEKNEALDWLIASTYRRYKIVKERDANTLKLDELSINATESHCTVRVRDYLGREIEHVIVYNDDNKKLQSAIKATIKASESNRTDEHTAEILTEIRNAYSECKVKVYKGHSFVEQNTILPERFNLLSLLNSKNASEREFYRIIKNIAPYLPPSQIIRAKAFYEEERQKRLYKDKTTVPTKKWIRDFEQVLKEKIYHESLLQFKNEVEELVAPEETKKLFKKIRDKIDSFPRKFIFSRKLSEKIRYIQELRETMHTTWYNGREVEKDTEETNLEDSETAFAPKINNGKTPLVLNKSKPLKASVFVRFEEDVTEYNYNVEYEKTEKALETKFYVADNSPVSPDDIKESAVNNCFVWDPAAKKLYYKQAGNQVEEVEQTDEFKQYIANVEFHSNLEALNIKDTENYPDKFKYHFYELSPTESFEDHNHTLPVLLWKNGSLCYVDPKGKKVDIYKDKPHFRDDIVKRGESGTFTLMDNEVKSLENAQERPELPKYPYFNFKTKKDLFTEYAVPNQKMHKLLGDKYPENNNLELATELKDKAWWGTTPLDLQKVASTKSKEAKAEDQQAMMHGIQSKMFRFGSATVSMIRNMSFLKTKDRIDALKAARIIASGESLLQHPELKVNDDEYKTGDTQLKEEQFLRSSNALDALVNQRKRLNRAFEEKCIKKHTVKEHVVWVSSDKEIPPEKDSGTVYVFYDKEKNDYTLHIKDQANETRFLKQMALTNAERLKNYYESKHPDWILLTSEDLPEGADKNHTYYYLKENTVVLYLRNTEKKLNRDIVGESSEYNFSKNNDYINAYCYLVSNAKTNGDYNNLYGNPKTISLNINGTRQNIPMATIKSTVDFQIRIMREAFDVEYIKFLDKDQRPDNMEPRTAYVYFNKNKTEYTVYSRKLEDKYKGSLQDMQQYLLEVRYPGKKIERLNSDAGLPHLYPKDTIYFYADAEKIKIYDLENNGTVIKFDNLPVVGIDAEPIRELPFDIKEMQLELDVEDYSIEVLEGDRAKAFDELNETNPESFPIEKNKIYLRESEDGKKFGFVFLDSFGKKQFYQNLDAKKYLGVDDLHKCKEDKKRLFLNLARSCNQIPEAHLLDPLVLKFLQNVRNRLKGNPKITVEKRVEILDNINKFIANPENKEVVDFLLPGDRVVYVQKDIPEALLSRDNKVDSKYPINSVVEINEKYYEVKDDHRVTPLTNCYIKTGTPTAEDRFLDVNFENTYEYFHNTGKNIGITDKLYLDKVFGAFFMGVFAFIPFIRQIPVCLTYIASVGARQIVAPSPSRTEDLFYVNKKGKIERVPIKNMDRLVFNLNQHTDKWTTYWRRDLGTTKIKLNSREVYNIIQQNDVTKMESKPKEAHSTKTMDAELAKIWDEEYNTYKIAQSTAIGIGVSVGVSHIPGFQSVGVAVLLSHIYQGVTSTYSTVKAIVRKTKQPKFKELQKTSRAFKEMLELQRISNTLPAGKVFKEEKAPDNSLSNKFYEFAKSFSPFKQSSEPKSIDSPGRKK